MRIAPPGVSVLLILSTALAVGASAACSNDAPPSDDALGQSSMNRADPGATPLAPATPGGSNGAAPAAGTSSPAPAPAAGPGAFAKGAPFDVAKVANRSQMVSAMLTAFNYATATTPKAVAVNAAGLGYVSVLIAGTPSDAEKTALDACFVIGGAKPCGLLASGDQFAVDASALAASLTHVLAKPAALTDLPFLGSNARSAKLAIYQGLTGFKALAVALDGTVVTVPHPNDGTSIASDAEAQRLALERCEMQATFAPCTLFASGAQVVYDPAAPTWAPQIDWSRTTVQTRVPGMRDQVFSQFVGAYVNAVHGGAQGVLYIAADGSGGDAWNTSGLDAMALGRCNQFVGAGFTCFKYASQLSVLMTPQNIAAPTAAGAAHCQSMPRVDCASHKAMGCTTSGMHYTTGSGAVKLEMCTF